MEKRYLFIFMLFFLVMCAVAQPVTITPPSANIQLGESVTLTASGATYYQWSPATGLSTTEGPVVVASPMVTTTYTCSGYAPGAESVVNGNFDQGNVGFTSAYQYNTNLFGEGTYFVDSDASLHHENFVGHGHGGTGNFMIVNGATSPGINVWTEQITVVPNTYYAFSTWVCTLAGTADQVALLQFSINGNQLGEIFSAPPQLNTWQQFYELWYSGTSTSATITILNQNTVVAGNDFGLDDISFCEIVLVGEPQCTVSVGSMSASATADDTDLCEGESTTLHAMPVNGSGNYTYSWTPTNTLNNPTSQHPVATPNVGTTTYYCHIVDVDWNNSQDVNVGITVHPTYDETTIDTAICFGESYDFYGTTFDYSVTDIPHTLQTGHGCDSIVRLNLTVWDENPMLLDQRDVCTGDTLIWFDGNKYYQDGDVAYYDSIGSHGCPQVYKLELSVGEFQTPLNYNPNVYVCVPHDNTVYYHWDIADRDYYDNAIDSIVVDDPAGGCPFKYHLNLKFHQEFYEEVPPVIVCDEYYWPISGITYNEIGNHIITKTFHHSFGDVECDSTYVLNLTINQSSTQETYSFDGECNTVTFPWFGEMLSFTKDCDTLLSGQTPDGCLYEVNLHISNMRYTPKPVIAYADDSYYQDGDTIAVITNTEFFSFQYDFFIEDSLGHFNDWDSCVWHRSKDSWLIEPFTMEEWPHRKYCRIFVAEHDDTPVELSCTVYNNHCDPHSITRKFYLKSSFFDIDEQNDIHPDFCVLPNPNSGQMTLFFDHFEGKVDIKVYDVMGNLIDSFVTYNDMESKVMEYNLPGCKGMYFLVANGKGGTIAKKVIVR